MSNVGIKLQFYQINMSNYDPFCGVSIDDEAKFCSKYCEQEYINNLSKYSIEPLLKFRNVKKSFMLWDINTEILKWVSFNIWNWEFVSIIWSSGSWKSTTLNMIWLLDSVSDGEIYLKWEKISALSDEKKSSLRLKNFGFIFQQYNLIPWLSAYENITLPLIFAEKDSKLKKIEMYIKTIWLENRMHHKPLELSWWEQQRVALLRAIVNNPEIIIGDEPTWNLDSSNWDKILKILIDLNKEEKKTLIIVTHDINIAKMANRIISLKDWNIISWNLKLNV